MIRSTIPAAMFQCRPRSSLRVFGAPVICLLVASLAWAQTGEPRVGIEEHLDRVLPLDELTFTGEDGQKVVLKDLFDLPVVLTLVYFRCPGICTPLLNEVARLVDLSDLEPGRDYRLVTISFDPAETPDLARHKRDNLLATMKHRKLSPDAWRFLTGDEQNIRRITEDVGFYYVRDKNKVDFVHAAAVTFVSPKGKISRYLTGVQFNPPDFKMAVLDASVGRSRSFMDKMQQLCYTYDPDSRSYVLQINRIILGVTILVVITFALVLVFKGHKKQPPVDSVGGDAQ